MVNCHFVQTNLLQQETQCHLSNACLIVPLMLIFVTAENTKRKTNELTDDQCFDKSKSSPLTAVCTLAVEKSVLTGINSTAWRSCHALNVFAIIFSCC